MNLEEMQPEHLKALKARLPHSDTVLDVQMIGYLDMYGDGSRNYIVYVYDKVTECFVISNFEYDTIIKNWILHDLKRIKTNGEIL